VDCVLACYGVDLSTLPNNRSVGRLPLRVSAYAAGLRHPSEAHLAVDRRKSTARLRIRHTCIFTRYGRLVTAMVTPRCPQVSQMRQRPTVRGRVQARPANLRTRFLGGGAEGTAA